jgi:multidrug transporter EmrE-like cation transporter
MTDAVEDTREQIRRFADMMKIAVFLMAASDVYEVFDFLSSQSDLRQGISIAMRIMGTIAFWLFSSDLRALKKRALYYGIAALVLGPIGWIVFDGDRFHLNIISIILIFLAVLYTLRIGFRARSYALT